MITESSTVHKKEAEFHDQWAAATDVADIEVRAAFEAITAPENRFILSRMGALEGKKILDIGAGLGESSVYFALQGAEVTMVDISPKMIELAQKLAAAHGVKLHGVVSTAESLEVPASHFDYVYVANLLHHITDRDHLFRQISIALKPGGKFFSWDPIAYNPVINVYRKMATKVRTEDESPLTTRDLKIAGKYFAEVEHREFWLLTLTLFLKYFLIDRVHPNADRYWKRILHETPRSLWWFTPLQKIDALLARVPLVRWLAWNIVLCGTKRD